MLVRLRQDVYRQNLAAAPILPDIGGAGTDERAATEPSNEPSRQTAWKWRRPDPAGLEKARGEALANYESDTLWPYTRLAHRLVLRAARHAGRRRYAHTPGGRRGRILARAAVFSQAEAIARQIADDYANARALGVDLEQSAARFAKRYGFVPWRFAPPRFRRDWLRMVLDDCTDLVREERWLETHLETYVRFAELPRAEQIRIGQTAQGGGHSENNKMWGVYSEYVRTRSKVADRRELLGLESSEKPTRGEYDKVLAEGHYYVGRATEEALARKLDVLAYRQAENEAAGAESGPHG